MKHPLLESLGERYPVYLEKHHDHILQKVDFMWDQPEVDDYLNDLLIDKRGNRKGFAPEAIREINALREFRMIETLNASEKKEAAIQALQVRGITVSRASFFHALTEGNREVIDLFIRANFNVHQRDDQGTPPLLLALKLGYTVIAKILLNAGVDVNEKDRLGLAPLLVACGKPTVGYKDVAAALIRKGAHVNVRDALGHTPLLLAITGGNSEIARLLIDKGANPNIKNRQQETALTVAEAAGLSDVVELLRSRCATPCGADTVLL